MKNIKITKKEKKNGKHFIEATSEGQKVFLVFQRERGDITDNKIKKIIEGLK